jgi:hypothetical protein
MLPSPGDGVKSEIPENYYLVGCDNINADRKIIVSEEPASPISYLEYGGSKFPEMLIPFY